jgi:hypothetical protein
MVNADQFRYYIIYRQPNGGGVYARRDVLITTTDRFAYHDLMIADPISSGSKIADRLLKRAAQVYRKVCIKRIELVAGLSRGGALWAKFGFRPKTDQDWQNCRDQIRENLTALDESVQLRWGDVVESIVAMRSPRAIWLISEIREQVQGVKLGDRLLSGTIWPGVLDFDDSEACQMLDDRLKAISE